MQEKDVTLGARAALVSVVTRDRNEQEVRVSLEELRRLLETAGGEEIVAAVTAHLEDEGYSTTLKPALLTAEVLGRCGVRFEQAKDCKGAATAFLASAREIGAKAVTPDDGFYYTENIL